MGGFRWTFEVAGDAAFARLAAAVAELCAAILRRYYQADPAARARLAVWPV